MPDYLSRHTGNEIDDGIDRVSTISSEFDEIVDKVDGYDDRIDTLEDDNVTIKSDISDLDNAVSGKQDALPTPIADTYLHADADGDLEWSTVSGGSIVEITQQGGATSGTFYRPQPRDITVDGVISNNDALVPIAYSNLWTGAIQLTSAQYGLAPGSRPDSYVGIGPISSRYFRQTSTDGNSGVYDYYFRPAIATPLSSAIQSNVNALNKFYDSIDSVIDVSGKNTAALNREFARGDICVMTVVDVVNDKITSFNYDKSFSDDNSVKHHIFLTQPHEDFSREKIDVAKNLDNTCTITQSIVQAPSGSPQFGGGFDVEISCAGADMYIGNAIVMGSDFAHTADGTSETEYGLHQTATQVYGSSVTAEHVAFFILQQAENGISYVSGPTVTLTGTAYAFDGTKITTANIFSYWDKPIYPMSDVTISFYNES